jgi:hypothetical protein
MVARAGPCGAGNACTLRTAAPSSSGKHSAQPSRSARFDAQEGYDDPPSIRNARLLWFPFHLSGALMKRWFSFSPTQTRSAEIPSRRRPAARRPRRRPAGDAPPRGARRASPLSTQHVLQHGLVQRQIRYQPLQLGILLLKLLQPSNLDHAHPGELLLPRYAVRSGVSRVSPCPGSPSTPRNSRRPSARASPMLSAMPLEWPNSSLLTVGKSSW